MTAIAASGYIAHPIVDGFPAKSPSHGAFGWSSAYLLLGHGRIVLVETGPPGYVPLIRAALAAQGIDVHDVTDVLLTHAHWDHLSNIMMFPGARLWIGAAELEWASRLPADEPFMSPLHTRELLARGEGVGLLDDGDRFLPGIEALATPGHTPGHLAFAVDAIEDPLIFAGDSVKNLHEFVTSDVDSTLDPEASRTSIRRLRRRVEQTGAVLVPGHDVPLRFSSGSVARTRPQRAEIGFFATADGPSDRSIRDDYGTDPSG